MGRVGEVFGGAVEGLFGFGDYVPLFVAVAEEEVFLEEELVGEVEHTNQSEPEALVLQQSLMIPRKRLHITPHLTFLSSRLSLLSVLYSLNTVATPAFTFKFFKSLANPNDPYKFTLLPEISVTP